MPPAQVSADGVASPGVAFRFRMSGAAPRLGCMSAHHADDGLPAPVSTLAEDPPADGRQAPPVSYTHLTLPTIYSV